jgi:ferredoxin
VKQTIRIDRIACTAHGVCAELLPELIDLDEWGYPVLRPGPVPPELGKEARRAVAGCPAMAMRLEPAAGGHPPRRP